MDFKKTTLLLLFISILIFGCKPEELLIDIENVEAPELSEGSGFLVVDTLPSDANIYLDNIYNGKSPTTVYNIEAGSHVVIIKKESYEDSISDVAIEAGKKSYLDVVLMLIPEVKEEAEENEDEIEETIEDAEEEIIEVIEEEGEIVTRSLQSNGVVNIGKKFSLFYDFSKGNFTDKRRLDSDTFSKRYESYIVFTRFNPVNIKVIEKSINDVEKEDCIGIKGQFEFLYSGQSLCIITIEGKIAAIGGTWDNTENAKLTWKLFG